MHRLRLDDAPGPKRAALLAALAALAALTVAGVSSLSRYPFDDAFIHLRIAENLATRGVAHFNPGERVLADSSPLWLALLAGGFVVGGVKLVVARILCAASAVAALVAADALLARCAGPRRVLATLAAALAMAAFGLAPAGFLMESTLALALLTAATLARARGEARAAGVLLGLAAMTRLELTLAVPIFALLLPTGASRVRLLSAAALTALPFGVALLAAFRTVIPLPILAKRVVYAPSLDAFVGPMPALLPPLVALGCWVAAFAMVLAAFGARARAPEGDPSERETDRAMLSLAATGAAVFAAYFAQRRLVFPWYWCLAGFPLVLGAAGLLLRDRRPVAVVAALVACVVAAPFAGNTARSMQASRGTIAPSASWAVENMRIYAYARVGAALRTACPDARVMAPEIGALGWTLRGPMTDAVGLTSPEVLRFHPLAVPEQRASGTDGSVPRAAVLSLRPDVVVSMTRFAADLLGPHRQEVALAYRFSPGVAVFDPALQIHPRPTRLWSSPRIILALRRDGRCGEGALPALAQAVGAVDPRRELSR